MKIRKERHREERQTRHVTSCGTWCVNKKDSIRILVSFIAGHLHNFSFFVEHHWFYHVHVLQFLDHVHQLLGFSFFLFFCEISERVLLRLTRSSWSAKWGIGIRRMYSVVTSEKLTIHYVIKCLKLKTFCESRAIRISSLVNFGYMPFRNLSSHRVVLSVLLLFCKLQNSASTNDKVAQLENYIARMPNYTILLQNTCHIRNICY